MYKYKIINTYLPRFAHYKYSIKLEVLKKYDKDKFPLDFLKKFGVKSVRRLRSVPEEFVNFIKIK